jgi:hypothetical protein
MPASRESDFLIYFEVMLEDRPVLIVELKLPGDFRYTSKREAAEIKSGTVLEIYSVR